VNEQAALAARALAITSAGSYSWFGRRSRPLPSELPPDARRECLTRAVTARLYHSFYVRGTPLPRPPDGPPVSAEPGFVEALSAANAGAGGSERGWRRVGSEGGALILERERLRVRAAPAQWRGPDRLRRGKERRAASPGFYMALGDALPEDPVEVRVYLHVTAAGAVPLTAALTTRLNGDGIPFVLKVLDHPVRYTRCDAAVLYLDRADFERARPALTATGEWLRSGSPAFTLPLARGVSLAEYVTSDGGSFGTSRCRLVAEGLVDAYEHRARGLPERLDAVAARFAARGLDLEAPHLATRVARSYVL
jgi:hypothetical protein